ncbi:MAG TPA: hypothetical protein VI792_02010 [Candidatus Eisenbacteria bacterium]
MVRAAPFLLALVLACAASAAGARTAAVTINFDDHPAGVDASTLYQSQGITFTRDDGQGIPILDWSSLRRTTTSPPNVLATIYQPPVSTTYVTHLNVIASAPLVAIGAYFGNDQGSFDFAFIRLTAYDASNQEVGSVEVAVNNNTSVDQFIGLTSAIPFVRARFENFASTRLPSGNYSVVLDDLTFTKDVTTAAGTSSWGKIKRMYR